MFRDRRDAGRRLAAELADRGVTADLVLALPRGGVPVGREVADALGAPLDVFVVRKLGVPGHEELAMGAVAGGGVVVLDEWVIAGVGVSRAGIEVEIEAERREVVRRERDYRGDRPPLDLAGREVVLVDDGLATGSSMRAAVEAVRGSSPSRVVVAVPVAPRQAVRALARLADEVVAAETPVSFSAVGGAYDDFTQTTDDEVRALLAASGRR